MCNSWHTHLCMSVHRWQCQTETLFHLLFQFPALKGWKFPLAWASSSRSRASVHLIWGNRALRLAPERARHVLRCDPVICKPKPIPFNQFFKNEVLCMFCPAGLASSRSRSYDTCSTGRICTSPIWGNREQRLYYIWRMQYLCRAERISIMSVMMRLWFDLSVWTGYSLKK